MRTLWGIVVLVLVVVVGSMAASADAFDGTGEYQTSDYGYYYAITGGLASGHVYDDGTETWSIGGSSDNVINGDNATGGTFRYLTDDPAWGYTIQTWHHDDWFPTNMSLALTLQNGGGTVYDNNGILAGTYGSYYDGTGIAVSGTVPGLYRGYSMSNNWDWIYAGMFILGQETTFDSITGFFDETAGFNRNDPNITYRMNIWSADSNVAGPGFTPVNTGSFDGDVFSTDTSAGSFASGTFTTFDTGVDRVFGDDYGNMHDDIFGLTYLLGNSITLGPGVYFFSHDATITPVPEPATLTMAGLGLSIVAVGRARRRRRT